MILLDPEADATLLSRGYTTVPLLSPGQVHALRTAWEGLDLGDPATPEPFDAGFVTADRMGKQRAHALVVGALGPAVAEVLPGHRALIGTFAVKRADPASAVAPHQDWCVVDERRWRSLSVWCALDDVDDERGALAFLPGTQDLTVLRGSGIPESCAAVRDLPDDWFDQVPLRAGEALVYFHTTIHRSGPNRSSTPRVAAMLGLVPVGADVVHYHHRGDGTVEVRRADTDFYVDYAFADTPLPASSVVLGTFAWDRRRVELDDVTGLSR